MPQGVVLFASLAALRIAQHELALFRVAAGLVARQAILGPYLGPHFLRKEPIDDVRTRPLAGH